MSWTGKAILLALLAGLGALAPAVQAAAAATPEPAAQAPKRILVIYDEDKDDLPGLGQIDRSLRESFRSRLGKEVQLHSESLALSHFDGADYDSLAADFYRRKYANARPDLIVAVLEPSLDFLLRHADTLFPGVPIVFSGVDSAAIERRALPANVTGVLVKRTYSPTLEVVRRLQPHTRNVFVVSGASRFDRYLETLARRDLKPFEGRFGITYLSGLPMDALLERVRSLPADSVVLYTTVFTDGAGRNFVTHEVMSSIAATANAPVYVFLDQYVGLGAVGGNVYSFETHASHVAELGVRILRGASPANVPVLAPAAQVDMFDARQLKRWNLDEARLPPGSVIRNQEPTAWATYRWYVVAAIFVVVMQGALIAGLLLARRRQRMAEAEARRQRDDLAHVLRVTTLNEMSSELAHEISQPIAAVQLNAQAALLMLEATDTKATESALADIVANADYATLVIERLRKLFRKERPEQVAVDVRTLVENVVRLLHAARLVDKIDIRVELADTLLTVFGDPVQLEQVLLNVVRNACDAIGAGTDEPRGITIRTRQGRSGHVVIEVSDTGVGVETADLEHMFEHFVSTKTDGLGMGLAISRSIVNAHGGRIWATANADRGLTMHIELVAWPSDARSAAKPAVEVQAAGSTTTAVP